MRVLHLIRHGATHYNHKHPSRDRIRGWKDVKLSSEGYSEAYRLALEVARNPPARLFCSDLVRAIETANIIAKRIKIPLEKPSKEFRPWNVGDFTGRLSSKVFPMLAVYALKTPDKRVPGGESFDSFRNRFLNGLARILRDFDGELGIVAHHRNERFLVSFARAGFPWDGSFDEEEFMRKGKPTGALTIVQIPTHEKPIVAKSFFAYNRLALAKEHLSRRA